MSEPDFRQRARELKESLYCDCVKCAGVHDESTCAFEITVARALESAYASGKADDAAPKQEQPAAEQIEAWRKWFRENCEEPAPAPAEKAAMDELVKETQALGMYDSPGLSPAGMNAIEARANAGIAMLDDVDRLVAAVRERDAELKLLRLVAGALDSASNDDIIGSIKVYDDDAQSKCLGYLRDVAIRALRGDKP